MAIVQTLVVGGLINVALAATAGLWGVLVTDQNPPPTQINVALKLGEALKRLVPR